MMRAHPLQRATFALVLAAYPMVAAAENDAKVEAGQHFDRGLTLAKQKAYVEAINEFNRAYQLSPHFTVMYNLGQAYLALEQPVYAVDALRRYLVGGKDEIPPARRQQVEAVIAAQERLIATVTVYAEAADVVVHVDGYEVGRTPLAAPLRLAAGRHVVAAVLPGYEPWEQQLDVVGQEQRTLELRLVPSAAVAVPFAALPPQPVLAVPAPAALPATTTVTPTTRQSRGRTVVAGIVGGAGLGALAVGSVFGLRAFAKKSSSDDHCPQDQCTAEGVQLNDEAKTAATVSTITFGVGLAAVAVATYLWLSPGRASASPAQASAGHLRLAPEVGPGQAGMTVRGVW